MSDAQQVMRFAEEHVNRGFPIHPVQECQRFIKETVRNLRTRGSTALGPALAFSLAIAKQSERSEVVLCTDGLANTGCGSMSSFGDGESFYLDMGRIAANQHTKVSVLAIEGSDVKLSSLSNTAEISGKRKGR